MGRSNKCKLDRTNASPVFSSRQEYRIIIGFKRTVAIVHEMRLAGAETQHALPPRTHEITNLSWALEKGIAVPLNSESRNNHPQAFRDC